jgi:hypothetical protein
MKENKNLILSSTGHTDLRLRTISQKDIGDLRAWKNENKNSFFLKQEITAEQQEKWYAAFSGREHDQMFVVEQLEGKEWKKIGCMGFRKLEEEGCVDAYNIIRSRKIEPASFTMSDAFRTMLSYAASLYPDLPLRVKVLSNNPAVEWYQINQFSVIGREKEYVLMEMKKGSLTTIAWSINQTL